MNTLKYLCLTLLLCSLNAVAAPISLPTELPELSATKPSKLGTHEVGVGVANGSKIKNFTIKSHQGRLTSFNDLIKQGDIMVVFYRGGWCPYCNMQIRQLTEAWPEFKRRGITPVLISADKPDASMMAQKTYDIPFPVLSDPKLTAHKAFNVVFKLPDELVKTYQDYGIVLKDWSGKKHNKFAVASAFIVDKNGVVKWGHSSNDYKTRPSVEQLIKAIDQLKAR
ncbi:AhpC/TSA family protein [Dasania sp. GY-MA-18]|uniref:thioredoxin-dependent peroxiredoxin n=1 Tax=Dasania phycosphaerae TaxID=2950436 RepID=A0A9J6RI04_9GAMM|nr:MULTISPECIES: peroxiredoxin-like family protein [Dasania]MCR8921882.1 AhpC/TSA family protein [Dasania sp. GY-MA-18]MCZ0864310.1 peroxiredoxin-like family protein [Dasania phycosphaerae]MCZ0868038.1 peroxiredoxin-like family protein [Dasania phycosphaerae]